MAKKIVKIEEMKNMKDELLDYAPNEVLVTMTEEEMLKKENKDFIRGAGWFAFFAGLGLFTKAIVSKNVSKKLIDKKVNEFMNDDLG